MILLNGNSLTAARVVPVEKMGMQLREKESSATLTPADPEGISVGSWLQDNENPGAGIVWRARSIQQAFDQRTVQITLEHIICTLKDRILFGEITAATITGNTSATTCTAKQAIQYILSQQSDWTLGNFSAAYESVSNSYKFNGDTLFDALETVTKTLSDAWWSYGMNTYPFTLNITQKSSGVGNEMRAGRNLRTISRTIDRTGMYTRFYPIGKDDLHVSGGGYVEKNVSTYGIVSKVETDNSLDTEAELTAWANERLNAHAQPTVTIKATGLAISQATGETLDALEIGKICRVPLPEYDTTIQERILELNWGDKKNQPEDVQVTMANSRTDATRIISDALKKSGRSSRATAKRNKEDHAWFEDTNDHVSMTAIGIIGVDAQGNPNWTRMSEFIADGEGLHAKVETQIGGITDRVSSLEVSETEIRADVAAASSTMYSVVSQTATNFHTEVSKRAKVFIQLNDPALDPNIRPTLSDGDIWIKATSVHSWSEMNSTTWTGASTVEWNRFSGAEQNVWDSVRERWEPVSDRGLVTEWGTRIDQTERNISLIVRAIGAIDPTAIAEIDVSAEAISLAVSTAKSELYSVVLQTATNISSQVSNNIAGISSYIDQTASTINQAVAKKNKVYIQLTDPAASGSGNTVIDGDIWIQSTANDNIKPTWSELSAKTWTSQSSTNWRDYYSSKWYARKSGAWELMREDADVVEIGTKIEQDEKQIALIARTVDANHQELGSRLTVTAQSIRGEVHAAKSTLYSVIEQTATQIRAEVQNTTEGLQSSITQTASSIATQVSAAKSTLYSVIEQTATQINSKIADEVSGLSSSITQTASSIRSEVTAAKSTIYSSIEQTASSIRSEVANDVAGLSSSITQTASSISAEVTRAQNKETELEGKLIVEAGKAGIAVSLKDNRTVLYYYSTSQFPAEGDGSKLYLSVSTSTYYEWKNNQYVTCTGPGAELNAASVVTAINDGESSVIISADHINLNGYVKATDITANYLKAKLSDIDLISTYGITVSNNVVSTGGYVMAPYVYLGTLGNASEIHDSIHDLQIVFDDNDKEYTLQKKDYNSSSWVDVGTFKPAATTLGGSWSSNTYTVTASPQGETKSISVKSRFGASNGHYFAETYDSSAGTSIGNTSVEYKLAQKGNYVEIDDTNGTRISNTPNIQVSATHSIDIPTDQIYTSDRSTGTKLNVLRNKYETARADGDYVMFRVDCGGTVKWYYMEP